MNICLDSLSFAARTKTTVQHESCRLGIVLFEAHLIQMFMDFSALGRWCWIWIRVGTALNGAQHPTAACVLGAVGPIAFLSIHLKDPQSSKLNTLHSREHQTMQPVSKKALISRTSYISASVYYISVPVSLRSQTKVRVFSIQSEEQETEREKGGGGNFQK